MIEKDNIFSEDQSSSKNDKEDKGLRQPNTQPQPEFLDPISVPEANEQNGPEKPKLPEKDKPEIDKDSEKKPEKPEISEGNIENDIDNPKGDDNYPGTENDDKFYVKDI